MVCNTVVCVLCDDILHRNDCWSGFDSRCRHIDHHISHIQIHEQRYIKGDIIMPEINIWKDPKFIAEAIEFNRRRELEFRGRDLGIGFAYRPGMDLNVIAAELSALIDEVNNG